MYPPHYVVENDCKTEGPVTACALNKHYGNYPRLTITYNSTGYLWAEGSPLSAWVSLNGVSDTFGPFIAVQDYPFTSPPTGAYYPIGSISNVDFCYHATVEDNSTYPENGQFKRCPVNEEFPLVTGPPTKGYADYYYDPVPAKDLRLITPASTNFGQPQWDVQIAVFNAKGNWDSKFGANYRFTFA
ncbi:hypothetical protein HDU97_001909 [Phlyctochytrium planicorne]|nr:hypothetical protein HDU97_001909 [Phlyctochytrium planicorne]